jgi:predicted phosphodiesterase
MKIQVTSDLHIDLLAPAFRADTLIRPAPSAELLVLAGDIHWGTTAVELFRRWPVPVIYIVGNHEFYDASWAQTRVDLKKACAGTQVHFLDNASLVLDGVRILGTTLWTDFQVRGFTHRHVLEEVGRRLNDYYRIQTPEGVLQTVQTLEDHRASRRWLSKELAESFEGKTVVVTHHAPHPLSVHPQFLGDPVNGGFVSDLSELMSNVDLWIHGHGHHSFDYRVDRCRVVSNPAGYVRNSWNVESIQEFEFENKAFVRDLVIEV